MRLPLLLTVLLAMPPAAAQTQTTLYPGQSGAALLSSIRAGYTPTASLGYNAARDELYTYEQATDGALCGVYTQFCVQLPTSGSPRSQALSRGINAEHTWPQSRGAGSEPARSDLHHLFPSKTTANSARGSDPLREIADADTDAWYRGSVQQSGIPGAAIDEWSEDDNTSSGGFPGAFEPRDDHKGDAARALFYVRAIYASQTSGEDAFFDAMKEDLIDWHYADPVSAEEAARSSWIEGRQGRENPFILDSTLARRAFDLGSSGGGGGGGGGGGTGSGDGTLWVNELHYDNAGTDADEGVEIAGPAGTALDGWTLVFYNGNGGSLYDTVALSGTVPDQQGGHGTVWVAVAGVQNGAPDGVALVDPAGAVAEFLSYEGAFTASGGPADGQTSTDIGVAEGASTGAGDSLQLTGTGSASADFAWAAAAPHTRGLPNTGQTFVEAAPPTAWINELHYANGGGSDRDEGVEVAGTAGLDLAGWSVVLYNGLNGRVYGTLPLSGTLDDEAGGVGALWFPRPGLQNGAPDGLALVDADGVAVHRIAYEGAFTAVGGAAAGQLLPDIGVSQRAGTSQTESLQLAGTGQAAAEFVWRAPSAHSRGSLNPGQAIGPYAPPPTVWINELHYDNAGADQNEGLEIAGTAGADLAGWSVVLYNGLNGRVYGTLPLSGTLDDEAGGVGALWFPRPGLQNGNDGLALVSPDGATVEFLSYEGAFDAREGPAGSRTATDVGQAELAGTTATSSLQRTGTGTTGADFTWAPSAPHSRGSLNEGQTIGSAKTAALLAAPLAAAARRPGATLFPNPTRGRATLTLALEAPAEVRADVFDALGRRVATVEAGEVPAGTVSLRLDLTAVPPGVYVVRVAAGRAVRTARLAVTR